MELIAAGVGLLALLLALGFTPLIRLWALKSGFVDTPGERKIHTREIAYGGGLAVAFAFAGALSAAWFAQAHYHYLPRDEDVPEYGSLIVVACGSFVMLLLGVVDDRRKLSAPLKLAVQLLVAGATVAGGLRITAFIGDNWVMKCVTVVWITLITNSFNLLDNMDGLCSGTVAIASGVLAVVAGSSGQWTDTCVLCALCGASAGFFAFNRAPASIFLGDAGSLFCGYVMACFTVLVTYYRENEPSHLAIGVPLLVLAIPLYDTASVILIRLKEGRPVMKGDTSHFSHRLTNLGMTRPQAVATIHLACLAIGMGATILAKLPESGGLLIIAQACLVLTIVALLERAGRREKK